MSAVAAGAGLDDEGVSDARPLGHAHERDERIVLDPHVFVGDEDGLDAQPARGAQDDLLDLTRQGVGVDPYLDRQVRVLLRAPTSGGRACMTAPKHFWVSDPLVMTPIGRDRP